MTQRSITETAAALTIGALALLALLGPGVLDPANILWMQRDDPATYYIGWSFFRATPWSWPPAANPLYGLELASTIYFIDIVPLMALAMKATIAPAEGPWQYHGAWLLLCFALQAAFAHRIAALFLPDAPSRLLVAAFACVAPVLLWRLNGPHAMTGHYALTAQWLLLAAGWLCLRLPTRRQGLAWVVLGVLAAMVHPYLLAMVLAGWVADIVRRAIGRASGRALAVEAAAVVASVAGALWLAGLRPLPGGGLGEQGFGIYRANLLTLFDPRGWSVLAGREAWSIGEYEGFAYLGFGGILALLGAVVCVLSGRIALPAPARWPLLAVVAGLAVFSLSNVVALGSSVLLSVPLPAQLEQVLSVFRATGRMVWPLHYLVLLGAVIVLAKRLGARRGPFALAGLLALQVIDGAACLVPIARSARVVGSGWSTPLADPFWGQAASRYDRLRRIPAANLSPGWAPLAYLAVTHGIGTDSVYLARTPRAPLAALRARGAAMIETGRFDAREFYVLDAASACAAAARIDHGRDLLMQLDGVFVLAPEWLPARTVPAAARRIPGSGAPPSCVDAPAGADTAEPGGR